MHRLRADGHALASSCAVLALLLGLAVSAAGQTTLSLNRVIEGPGSYTAGATLDVTVTFTTNGPDAVTQLGLQETLPSGWTYVSLAGGDTPQIPPAAGASGTIAFAYVTPPAAYPASFTYRIRVPFTSTGDQIIGGHAVYAAGGPLTQSEVVQTTIPFGGVSEGEGALEGEGAVEGEVAGMVMTRTVLDDGYAPGNTVRIQVTLQYTAPEPITALALEETLPAGWTYHSLVSGELPSIRPQAGAASPFNFAWVLIPDFPFSFVYRATAPPSATGPQQITGFATYYTTGAPLYSPLALTVIEEGVGEGEGAIEGEGEGAIEGEGEAGPVTLSLHPVNGAWYAPGGTVDLAVTIAFPGFTEMTALALSLTLPQGWTYNAIVAGDPPPVRPAAGDAGTLSFAYVMVPDDPVRFTVRLNVPANASGAQSIVGLGLYRTLSSQVETNTVTVTMNPLGLPNLRPLGVDHPDTVWAGQTVGVAYQAANPGANVAAAPWRDCVYLSEDDQPGNDVLLACVEHDQDLAIDAEYAATLAFTVPEVSAGDYWLVLETDEQAAVEEDDETDNALVSGPITIGTVDYSVTVSVDIHEAPAGTPITLSGQATSLVDATPRADAPVVVEVVRGNAPRLLETTTDGSGQFALTLEPLPTEAGEYTVGARHPGAPDAPPQDSFTLYGLLLSPGKAAIRLAPGIPQVFDVQVINLGDAPLSGLSAEIAGLPANIAVTPDTVPDLGPSETVSFVLTLTASNNVPASATATVTVTSAEGAIGTLALDLSVAAAAPSLQTSSALLRAGAMPGEQTLFRFEVSNTGGAVAEDFTVIPPAAAPWLSVVAPAEPLDLAPGAMVPVTLQLLPPSTQPAGLMQTVLEFRYGTSASLQAPLTINVTNQAAGTLQVTAKDEFAYVVPAAPALPDVLMSVLNPTTGAVIANGLTNSQGRFDFTNLPAGAYHLQAFSLAHGRMLQTVVVTPGGTHPVEVRLHRDFVRQQWRAIPNASGGHEYPAVSYVGSGGDAPLITLNPPVLDLRTLYQASAQIDLAVANSGSRTARSVRLELGQHHRLQFLAPVFELGDLAPGETLVVPIWLEDTAFGAPPDSDLDCALTSASGVLYAWDLNNQTEWRREPLAVQLPELWCPSAAPQYGPLRAESGDVLPYVTAPLTATSLPCAGDPASTCQLAIFHIEESECFPNASFDALLLMSSPGAAISNVQVTLSITGKDGLDAASLFNVNPPGLNGIADISGSGVLAAGASASATWRITPKPEAAATDQTYRFGGTWAFRVSGAPVSAVLAPDSLDVRPLPVLDADVYYPAAVFGEDPSTAAPDPLDPFSAAIMLESQGVGVIHDLQLMALEPTLSVIDAGGLGGYTLQRTQSGADLLPAQFPLGLGSLASGGRALAYWNLTPAWSGQPSALDTVFVFRDAQGYLRSVTPAQTAVHDLVHVVRVDLPDDDFLPDFLVNATPDAQATPDAIHTSGGAVLPVNPASNAVLEPFAKQARVTFALTAVMPAGWSYLEVPAAVGEDFAVSYVRRGDGTLLPPENAWLTRRTVRPSGDDPREETLFHLIDFDGVGDYVVQFRSLTELNTRPVAHAGPDQGGLFLGASVVLDGAGSADEDGDPLTYRWRFTARPQGSGAVLRNASTPAPSFTADRRGNYVVELVVNDGFEASAPDTVTVQVVNRAPVAAAGPDQSLRPRVLVTLNGSGSSDADGDTLRYAWSLASQPSGSTAALSSLTVVSPSFTPDKAGDYVVQLIVNDSFTNSPADTVTIHAVNAAPVANAGPDQSRRVSQTVTLDGSSSSDADGDPLTFAWTFISRPSGSQAALGNAAIAGPSFVIDVSGDYVLRLTVSDGFINGAPDTVTVHTENTAPVANAGANLSERVGVTVTLNGTASSDADRDPLSFAWTFVSRPAASAAVLANAATASPSFTLDTPGVYVAQLVVNDGKTASAPATVNITTVNSPPVAHAGPDQGRRVGQSVTLDGSGSDDIDGDALVYRWSFASRPTGSSAALSNPNTVAPVFSIDAPGIYVVRLIVNDGTADSAPDDVVITTQNSPPTANAGPDQTRPVGSTVILDGSASSDPDQDQLTYSWTLGTRPAGSAAALDAPTAVAPRFTLDVAGTYVARLVVNDGQLSSPQDTVTISTENSAPRADAGANQTQPVGSTVTLSGSRSSDVDNDTLQFRWGFTSTPEGSAAVLINPNSVNASFSIDRAGEYNVQLIVNDGKVDSAPAVVTISTLNSPPVPDPGPNQTRTVGARVTLDGSGSVDPDNDELTFQWSFVSRPTGSSAALNEAGSATPWFTIDLPGEYVIQLIVADPGGPSAPATVTVSTVNSAPVAVAGPDQSIGLGDTVELDGTGSYDADGDEITYSWSFTTRPLASATNLDRASAARPKFVADFPGTYILQLYVGDGKLYGTPDTVVISTGNSPPIAHAGPDQTRLLGQTVTLDGRASSDPDGDPLTYQWNFTSRPSGSAAALTDTALATPNFRIDLNGTYIVQLVVSDGIQNSDPDTVLVSTINSRPVANAGLDQSVSVGDTVTLDGRQSSDPDGDVITYRWTLISLPAGTTAALNNPALSQPSFQADVAGSYAAQLIVNDGAFDSLSDSVTVHAGAVDDCTSPPEAPALVTASDGDFPDRVLVEWTAVNGAQAYRVYRSATPDSAAAEPVSDWISATSFNDASAPPPITETPAGCGCAAQPAVTPVNQYYWVLARTTDSCVSDFGASDLGYRGEGAKSLSWWWPLPVAAVPALPDEALGPDTRLIAPSSAIFIRIQSPDEDLDSVWGAVSAPGLDTADIQWIPVMPEGTRDGWAAYFPETPWQVGDTVRMTAQARTVSGVDLESITFFFEVWPEEAVKDPVWQPGYEDLDVSQLDLTREDISQVRVDRLPAESLPDFQDAQADTYRIGPRAAFSSPQRVWLPLPDGLPADQAQIYFLFDDGDTPLWLPGDQITGWLATAETLTVNLDAGPYLGFLVTHGGTVRLGRIAPAPQVSRPGSLAYPPYGDLLLLALTVGMMGIAARRRQRTANSHQTKA